MSGSVRRLVGLEEHYVTPGLLAAWGELPTSRQGLAYPPAVEGETSRRLLDLGDERLAAMDATGLDVAVLALHTPGVQNLPADLAQGLAADANDVLADAVRAHPDRYQGLAAAPSVAELDRAVRELGLQGAMVFGRTGDRPLDHPDGWDLFEAAEALHVPLELHPQAPPDAVRAAYYTGLGAEPTFATHGLGWHYDAGVAWLRLALAGVFDRFPGLQVVVGHWGELVLFYLDRVEHLARELGLPRSLADYARSHLHVTPSGVLSERYLRWATEVVGPDRLLFATDYPFDPSSLSGARDFVDGVDLPDVDRELWASGNWARLSGA